MDAVDNPDHGEHIYVVNKPYVPRPPGEETAPPFEVLSPGSSDTNDH